MDNQANVVVDIGTDVDGGESDSLVIFTRDCRRSDKGSSHEEP